MTERRGGVTLKGGPVTLLGEEVHIGQRAPDCTIIDRELQPIKLSTFFGKTLVIVSVPSLDTPVCSMEAKRFSDEIAKLNGQSVQLVVVSMDLPFAQKRWCGAEKVHNAATYSDHRLLEFGQRYGVYIEEVGLLARAVFIIDAKATVRYIEVVHEVTNEPDYKAALSHLKNL